MRTVAAAIGRAPEAGTVILRGGSYHQRFTVSKRVTIQNYPGEAVWFDGSSTVSGFSVEGNAWRADQWNTSFDSSPSFTSGDRSGGFVNPRHPMAAHPDQVWIDGVAQSQVASRSLVRAGTFYVDDGRNRLYLGSNPNGKSIRASTLGRAIEVRAAGVKLRGFGVRRYAPSVPDIGTITLERPDIKVENLLVSDNSTVGVSVLARSVHLQRLTTNRNGLLGVHGNEADDLRMSHISSNNNNTELFNQAPVSGGVKITRSRGVTLENGQFERNEGPGFWLDESTYNGTIVKSLIRGNKGHGISLEISGLMTVAGNIIQDNARFGIKINNTSEVSVWNNTIADNDRPVNIVQDSRRGNDRSVPGHDRRRPFPDPTMPWIIGPVTVKNNVLAGSSGNCLLCVEDYSHEFTAEQLRVTSDNNFFQRDTSSAPRYSVIWSKGEGNPAVFRDVPSFASSTRQGRSSKEITGTEAVRDDGTTTSPVRNAAATVATRIPSSVAALLGIPQNSRYLGAQ